MEEHLGKLVLNRTKKYAKKVMMRIKKEDSWEEFTGEKCFKNFKKVAHSLLLENVEHQEKIGIYSQNMPEWSFADIGAIIVGAVPVPIYATNIASQAKYIIKDASIKVLFVGEQQQYDEVLKIIDDKDLAIKRVIVFDKKVELTHSKTTYFSDWISQNHAEVASTYKVREQQLCKDDLATIIYTSGTTGEPKGVMLSHDNIIITCKNHDIKYNLTDKDTSLAFLPLSHVFERLWTYYVFHKGMMNTYSKDPKQIANILSEAKPTVMCSVPRLYEKIYHLIYTSLLKASFIKKTIFNWSINVGDRFEKHNVNRTKASFLTKIQYKIADKLVLSKIRTRLGGNLKFMPCGGAFLSKEITSFFRAVGLPIVIGYGLTETTATVTSFDINNYKLGTVGKTIPNVEIMIGANDEILVKGGGVMKGYYNKPEETQKVFKDGWFKTGDAGKIDKDGNLIITDRIKDLIKTSGGKYIAPQHVEVILTNHNFIEQAIVVGENKPYASALLVPNFEALFSWAENKKIEFKDKSQLILIPEVEKKYTAIVNSLQECLAQFEKVKKFTLMPSEFTMEKNEITPTFKPRRKIIYEKYSHIIQKMYG